MLGKTEGILKVLQSWGVNTDETNQKNNPKWEMTKNALRYQGTPNDNIVFSPLERQAFHKDPNKLYIFWKLNNWRLRKRI